VVHGRDEALRSEVCRVLEKLGVTPVVLFEQVDKGRTIIEKFEDHSDVAYAVVLITPDDEGRLRNKQQLTPRARQNVVFELGFFYGKLGRQKVCAILKEGVEFPSDISGVIYKTADAAGAWKFALAKEMKAAGLDVDLNKLD
jgi:predicted nucleotide-binding protein